MEIETRSKADIRKLKVTRGLDLLGIPLSSLQEVAVNNRTKPP
jgi:hypothetical protein